jgi:uncharacterized damage-inducible protein DinB
MDLLDRLLAHDIWTTRQLLLQSKSLTDEQLDTPFDIDNRTLRACFSHIVRNLEGWTHVLQERPAADWVPAGDEPASLDDLLTRLSEAGRDFALIARKIARENRWDDEYIDVLDKPPRPQTFGGTIAHVITHSMHHRAQAMYIMERLGIRDHLEGDVLYWEHIAHGWY